MSGERPVGRVRGTRDWSPDRFGALARIEAALLDRFARAGYDPIRVPVLERTELHERKSGAGIVSKLYELADGGEARVCLRPELTAGVVRAYAEMAESPELPWRVSVTGPVFRHEAMRPGFDREFHQVGVEMLGAGGPGADAEVIWLAWWGLAELGIADASLRIGHVGLILEMFERSGLPEAARSALVERLSEAASEDRGVAALETTLEQLGEWLAADAESGDSSGSSPDDPAVDRLFRTLVPDVTGRRSGREVVARLRRKWELGRSLHEVIGRLRDQIRALAALRGPILSVLPELEFCHEAIAPESVASLRDLAGKLADRGVDLSRVELDLGFGRGIGFYSRMVFELVVPTPSGPVEVCGGGRYDGLARVLGGDRDDRGAGFAFGSERLIDALIARGIGSARAASAPAPTCVLAGSPECDRHAVRLADLLRSAGFRAFLGNDRDAERWADHADRAGLAVMVTGDPDRPGSLRLRDPWEETERSVSPEELARILAEHDRSEALA